MKVATKPWLMMYYIHRDIVPEVHDILGEWKKKAELIPDQELREQALEEIESKAFHCEGGGVYALLTRKEIRSSLLRFIVAYQIICDYLDGLCDKFGASDPDDFEALHTALTQALTPGAEPENYYRFRGSPDDGGYLKELVTECQSLLRTFPGFDAAQLEMKELAQYYSGLQIHKHVVKIEREPRLKEWYEETSDQYEGDLRWYEFSAATGSTLGIYTLAAYASRSHLANMQALAIKNSYFPYVQGLHILLDYFIDQEEDIADDELNFCACFPSEQDMINRINHIKKEAEERVKTLPDAKFHRAIISGVIAIYLADEKVQTDPEMKKTAKHFIRFGGIPTAFFYLNSWIYRREAK
ncbi:tetraprenyl-beta-curcumene synthase family protein [Alteribacillus sp. HJP-4]|uniref:tetraprenyl-beta-curcumene synthase family protein n=1 Tax=Alteribacillus sp. HJP-4 TaxID=2775394 RepID=UPI0035CD0E0E